MCAFSKTREIIVSEVTNRKEKNEAAKTRSRLYNKQHFDFVSVAGEKAFFCKERVNINTNTEAITKRHAHTLTK